MSRIAKAYEKAGRHSRPLTGAQRVAEATATYGEPETPEHELDDVPFYPQRVVRAIEECWPDSGIVTTDAGESRAYMLRWYRSRLPGGYLVPHGGGGMGYSLGAALGAKLAHPQRPVLAVCGDGGFAMTMNSLMNGLQEHVPFAVVIFNNRALGWPLHVMPEDKAQYFEINDFDYAAIARAMGCEGTVPAAPLNLRSP